jgi:hypothetical protein
MKYALKGGNFHDPEDIKKCDDGIESYFTTEF